ncbi:MAG: hypothetical protein ABH956_00025 [Candidatus Nealsonbacteria bacterium]
MGRKEKWGKLKRGQTSLERERKFFRGGTSGEGRGKVEMSPDLQGEEKVWEEVGSRGRREKAKKYQVKSIKY